MTVSMLIANPHRPMSPRAVTDITMALEKIESWADVYRIADVSGYSSEHARNVCEGLYRYGAAERRLCPLHEHMSRATQVNRTSGRRRYEYRLAASPAREAVRA